MADNASANLEAIGSVPTAMSIGKRLYDAKKQPGAVLLNAQSKIMAWVPLPESMRGPLRNIVGLNALYRAVSQANPAAAILIHGGELDGPAQLGKDHTSSQNIVSCAPRFMLFAYRLPTRPQKKKGSLLF